MKEMKRVILFYVLFLLFVACGLTETRTVSQGIDPDTRKMGYRGSVKSVKIDAFIPDTRAGVGLTHGKTISLTYDDNGRLVSSVGFRDVSKSCYYGENGKVSEIVEVYQDIKVHIFHFYDSEGNCLKIDLYKVQQGDSVLVEERIMEYNDKDSIMSYTSLPKPQDRIQTSVFYSYDDNDCMVDKRVYSALVGHKLDVSGEPITHVKIKYDGQRRPVEIENFSLVEDIFTKRIEYNVHGHISKEVVLRPDALPEIFVYQYTYKNNEKKVESYTLKDGVRVKHIIYNDSEQPLIVETLDPDGRVVAKNTYEYDAQGNVIVSVTAHLDADKGVLVDVYKEVKTIEYYE